MSVAPAAAPGAPAPSQAEVAAIPAAQRGAGPPARSAWRRFSELAEVRWALASVVFFAVAAIARLTGAPAFLEWASWVLCYATGGWEPALAGVRALRAKTLDVDLLMIVAGLVAAVIGQVIDGGLLIIIFSTSGALEAVATRQTQESVRSLLSLAPEQATRLVTAADGSVAEQMVGAGDLVVDDVIVIRPGEQVAADGEVVDGVSDIDQSSVTGEHVPATKRVGDPVFSGTVNTTGALRVRVARAASESVVARIVALVEEASATKAATQLWIEKIEQRYSVGVVVATLAFVAVPMVATDWSFQKTLLRAMTFMIVASPCAVVLATMPPLLSAVANAGRHGVLVKSTVVMEQLARVDAVVLDKTGTVTAGRPRVGAVTVEPQGRWNVEAVMALAAAVEGGSEHPLGAAIVADARVRGIEPRPVGGFLSLAGRGVRASVGGHVVEVVNPTTAASRVVPEAWWEQAIVASESTGSTAVVVTHDDAVVGVIALNDTVREDAREAIASLVRRLLHPPVLLTGDNHRAADHVASQVGITEVYAELLPEAKVRQIRAFQAAGRSVMVVGDGVNDAPALAAADLGMAMGQGGADITLQAADGVILRDRLDTLPALLGLARNARRMVLQNLGFAVTVIATLVVLDLLGHLPLPLGVAGHEGSTVIIGLNGLRLLRSRAWVSGRADGP